MSDQMAGDFGQLEKRLSDKKEDLVAIGKDYLDGKKTTAMASLAELATSVVSGMPWLGKVASAVVDRILVDPASEILDRQVAQWRVEQDQQVFALRVAAALHEKMLSGLRELYVEQSLEHQQHEVALSDVLCQLTKQNQALAEKVNNLSKQKLEASSDTTPLFEGPGALPATAVPDFLGRTAEMEELAQSLAAGVDQVVCVVLSGTGGMGKTALVRQFVATCAATLFPDGTAWLDGQVLVPELARVARRFGWDDNADPSPERAVTFLGQRLGNRRMLLVIDNLPQHPGLNHLHVPFPGGTCRTLITSRAANLALDLGVPARSIHLERWTADESRDYLRRVVPRTAKESDGDLDALSTFLDGLPLAIRLVARALLRDRELSAMAYLRRLQAEPLATLDSQAGGADRGIAATFQNSYQALAPDVRTVLLALAACAQGTRSSIVAAVAGLDESRVNGALNDLTDLSLADFRAESPAPWGMHDVVRLFSRAQSDAQLMANEHVGWVRSFLQRYSESTDFQAMDEGVDESVAAFHWLVAQGDFATATKTADQAGSHLYRRGRYALAIGLLQPLLDRLPPDGLEAARLLNNLGMCRAALGALPEAIELHHRALSIAERHGHQALQAIALAHLGACLAKMGDHRTALQCHTKSLELETHPHRRARAVGDQGSCLRNLGRPDMALVRITMALAMAEDLKDREGLEVQAILLGKLGDCYRDLGNLERAIETHRRAIVVNERLGRREGVANQINQMGLCYEAANKIPEAIAQYRAALAINESLPRPLSIAMQLASLGRCYRKLGQTS